LALFVFLIDGIVTRGGGLGGWVQQRMIMIDINIIMSKDEKNMSD